MNTSLRNIKILCKFFLKKVCSTGRKKILFIVIVVAKIVFCFISNIQRFKFNFCPVFCLCFGLVVEGQKGRSGSVTAPEPERETHHDRGQQGATGRGEAVNPQQKAKKIRKNS